MSSDARRKSNPRVLVLRGSGLRRSVVEEIVVLVVEDDDGDSRSMGRVMSLARARAAIVRTEDEARAYLDDRVQPCAAIIADMRLGSHVYGGADVLEHARIVRPELLAMAMTGSCERASSKNASAASTFRSTRNRSSTPS